MAKKPFPFSVCEECCTTGGGGTVDVTAIETIVIDNLSGVTAKQLIESSKEGSVFDIQGTLNLYNEGITFPERSTIISTTGDGVIYNPYDGSVDYVDVIISNNSTVKGVTFKSSATMSTPASTFKILNNCTFEDCTFIGELNNSSIYETGANNIFIGCDMGEFELKFSDTELTNTYVNCTGNLYIETDANKPEELKKAQYIKAMNPETVIIDWRTGTEVEPLYASPEDIPEAINGKDGYTPVRGVDYWTAADKAEITKDLDAEIAIKLEDEKGNIVDDLIKELQGLPVFGVVDTNNVIKITSQLTNGDYTLKYENTDGTFADVGTITIVDNEPVVPDEPDVPEVTYTNQITTSINADGSQYVGHNGEDGYSAGYRINSSGVEGQQDGMCCTGFIPYTQQTIRLKNVTVAGTKSPYIVIYNADKTYNQVVAISDRLTDDGTGVLTGTAPMGSAGFIRITCGVIDDTSILTLNEEIV